MCYRHFHVSGLLGTRYFHEASDEFTAEVATHLETCVFVKGEKVFIQGHPSGGAGFHLEIGVEGNFLQSTGAQTQEFLRRLMEDKKRPTVNWSASFHVHSSYFSGLV